MLLTFKTLVTFSPVDHRQQTVQANRSILGHLLDLV